MLIVAFCSCGNDSVALIQRLHELGHEGVKVVYSDTGWAAPDWAARVEKVRAWVNGLGFEFIETKTMGFPDLARQKSGFPMPKAGFQFCTMFLKILPALQVLDEIDDLEEAVCCIGVRREESVNRSQHPIWIHESEKHGGRMLWAPLAEVTERERGTPSLSALGSSRCPTAAWNVRPASMPTGRTSAWSPGNASLSSRPWKRNSATRPRANPALCSGPGITWAPKASAR